MSVPAGTRVDPITLEVMRNALPSIANEMSLDLQRSSYNMMIYEVGDYSCALLAPDGALISQNMGGVSHFVSDLGVVIRDGVERFGLDGFAPGDVVLTNHQRVAGQHLNNIVVYMPVFHEERLRGFAAIRAHWVDVGGMSTGFGAGGLAYDPWVEGLQLDQVKAWEGGVPDEKLLRVIRDNIRYPEAAMGDLRSQVAACRLAERRFVELNERYGSDVVEDALQVIFSQTEQKCRMAVEAMPDGVYEAETLMDGDPGDRGEPLRIHVKVTIAGSDMEIDLSGCSQQRRSAVNGRTYAGALVAYKALTAPEDPVNEGSFAAARVVIPEGNVMMARFPAPMAGWSMILPTVVDTVFRALAPAIPDQVAAGHFGYLGIPVVFFGVDPATGKRFVSQSIEGGGWGGRPFEDGPSASVSICQGDVRNGPIENMELKVPLVVEERALRTDSGGAGRYRGGLGVSIRLRSLVEGRWNLNQARRRTQLPWGLWGGKDGGRPDNLIQRPGDEELTSIDAAHVQAPAGTIVVMHSAGGGGWGDPLERDPALVLADVLEGVVSAVAARRDYGVVLDAAGTAVDEAATRALRGATGDDRLRSEQEGGIR
jgi:N-methylhydantoinase B